MKKIYLALAALAVSWALGTMATATTVSWESLTGDVTVDGDTLSINSNHGWNQIQGIHGAGTTINSETLDFSLNLGTWDSYRSRNWYDVLIVNINQDGYIFNDAWQDPVTRSDYAGGDVTYDVNLAGESLAWGGTSWTDRSIETLHGDFSLTLLDYDPTKYVYVSAFWKTDIDDGWGSWGEITINNNVAPVPEPATMFLFGTGLLGLAGCNRWKRGKLI